MKEYGMKKRITFPITPHAGPPSLNVNRGLHLRLISDERFWSYDANIGDTKLETKKQTRLCFSSWEIHFVVPTRKIVCLQCKQGKQNRAYITRNKRA